jgi:2-alkyl-3-oxoalkanoate reductase
MRIFLAGATGAIGRRLLPMLIEEGYDVVATTRTPGNIDRLAESGVEPVLMDGLDPAAVKSAVADARPDVVINQLTALASVSSLKRFDEEFAETNRLRTEGNDHLLAASRSAGVRRFIAQSFTGWTNPRTGDGLADESTGLDPEPVPGSERTLAAIRHLEEAVTGATDMHGTVLRYGGFYGPGTGLGTGGPMLEMVHKRRFPIVGNGAGVLSLIHIDDAARATVQAITHGSSGLYNIVDDDPAPVAEWVTFLAQTIEAKPPRRIPAWLARPLVGRYGVTVMTVARGSSNAKAKRELDWVLRYPSWRQGFRTGLG